MSSSILDPKSKFSQDSEFWKALKVAISNSSGFECWQQAKTIDEEIKQTNLDAQVSSYLRETLETLAY